MVKTTYESKYLLINFISEHRFLIYSLDSTLSKINQITLTRRPISSLYFLKLLKEVYNVDSNTIIGVTGEYNEKGKLFSLLYGYACANNIRIRKLDFYQACERVNARYRIVKIVPGVLVDWYKKYFLLFNSLIDKKSITFIDYEFLNIIENRSKKESILFKKSLILLLYIHIREEMYKSTKKSILKKDANAINKEKKINLSENRILVIV